MPCFQKVDLKWHDPAIQSKTRNYSAVNLRSCDTIQWFRIEPYHSKNVIYLIECKKCHLQYIGETKCQLSERFGEHRRSILNHQQLSTTTPVSLHFNQAGHSINDVRLIPIELIRSKRDSIRKAREAHLITKAKTLHPFGINRRDEAR